MLLGYRLIIKTTFADYEHAKPDTQDNLVGDTTHKARKQPAAHIEER